jgi:uncharacterized protein
MQIKPAGNNCNLKCKYCYAAPFATAKTNIMPKYILDVAIKKIMEFQKDVCFSWHGGEPLLPGLKFYQNAADIISKYKTPSHKIMNMVQTNATLITPEFAEFFKKNDFVISVSIDGPKYVHDANRIYCENNGSFEAVMRGVEILRQAGLNPPVIATVTKDTAIYAADTFKFFAENGFTDIKFSPVYDSVADNFSISADDWFMYLKNILDAWFKHGDVNIKIREIDEVIAWLSNKTINMCSSKQACLSWVSMDTNGDIYPCEYLRSYIPYGNIENINLAELQKTVSYRNFRKLFLHKPEKCITCDFFKLCGNGCPATRVLDGKMTHDGVYVYCEQRKLLFKELKKIFNNPP